MSTLPWSDAKRTFYLHVQELRHRRGDLERKRNALVGAYIDAASLRDPAERRRVQADVGRQLKAVGSELRQATHSYYSANVTLRGMT